MTAFMNGVKRLYFGLVVLYLLLPITVIFGVSLNARNTLLFPPQGVSLRWYAEFFTAREWLLPALNSVVIATFAALIAVSVALPLAYTAWHYRSRYARLLLLTGFAPFALPPIITALGALVLWTVLQSFGRPYTVVLSHGIFLTTLPLATITLGLQTLDPQLAEAARTLGADSRTTFRTVILPSVRPYILAGYIFAFVLSLNEYLIAYMTVGFTVETLPIKIFNSLRYGYSPVMASASLLFFILAVLLFSLIGRFGNLPKLLGADPSRD
jgi:putative spermidine/putrescine transport system permease protein